MNWLHRGTPVINLVNSVQSIGLHTTYIDDESSPLPSLPPADRPPTYHSLVATAETHDVTGA